MARKRLVVACDGTWNVLNPPPGVDRSNVARLAQLVEPRDASGVPQELFYQTGLGTRGPVDVFRSGYTGLGLDSKIVEVYRFLAERYEPGDEVFLFGMSRGGTVVRRVCQWLEQTGLVRSAADADAAWLAARDGGGAGDLDAIRPFKVRFAGAWDTVDALGLPFGGLRRRTSPNIGACPPLLGAAVENAFQALALHETRAIFTPVIWLDEPGENRRIEQVWFPGAHPDVCGGFGKRALADLSLEWMLLNAGELGLACRPPLLRGDPSTRPSNPLVGVYRLLPRAVRRPLETSPQTEWIHVSAAASAPEVLQERARSRWRSNP